MSTSIVLIFILVLVTRVHTTDIQCMQTLSMYSMGQMLNPGTSSMYTRRFTVASSSTKFSTSSTTRVLLNLDLRTGLAMYVASILNLSTVYFTRVEK